MVTVWVLLVAVSLELAFRQVAKLAAAAFLFDPLLPVEASQVGELVSDDVVVVVSVAVMTVPSVVVITTAPLCTASVSFMATVPEASPAVPPVRVTLLFPSGP